MAFGLFRRAGSITASLQRALKLYRLIEQKMEAQFLGMKRGLRDLFADPAAAAGPGRLKVQLPTCSVFGRPRGLLPIFQAMVGTSFPPDPDCRPCRIYLAYQQFCRVNNVA